MCTDYLKALRNEAIKSMTERLGKGVSVRQKSLRDDLLNFLREIVETTPKRYVVTVPASWSDETKSATKQCAIKAFAEDSDIEIIAEPQAAAIFVLKKKKALMPNGYYVVCDAGGGTVDLVTYQVLNTEPMELEVSGRGTGDICGSIFLNRRFEEYLAESQIGRLFQKPVTEQMGRAWEEVSHSGAL